METSTPGGIFPTDDWTVAEAPAGSAPFIVRMRSTLPSAADQALFCHLIIIKWVYEPNDFGMPDVSVHRQMNRFEDALEAGVERRRTAYQAASLTGSGQKEWRYYAADAEAFMDSLNADLTGHERYPLHIEMFQDSEWTALREIQDRLGDA